jgi:hypothetical protein
MVVLSPIFRVVPIKDGQPRPFPLFSAQSLGGGIFRMTMGLFELLPLFPFFPSLHTLFAGVIWELRGGSVKVLIGRVGNERGVEGGAVLIGSKSDKADKTRHIGRRSGSAFRLMTVDDGFGNHLHCCHEAVRVHGLHSAFLFKR